MAYGRRGRSRFARRYRRRTYRKRYRRMRRLRATSNPMRSSMNRSRIVNMWAKNVFPQRVKCKMNYLNSYTITATTGATASYQFRGNSVFDPDQSGTGTQPSCYDDMAAIYNDYTVLSSAIRITAINVTDEPALVCVYPYIGVPDTNDIEECSLMPGGTMKILSSQVGGGRAYLKTFMRTDKMYSALAMSDLDFMANTSSNPGKQWYWIVKVNSQNRTDTASVQITVKITYYVVWSGRMSQNED